MVTDTDAVILYADVVHLTCRASTAATVSGNSPSVCTTCTSRDMTACFCAKNCMSVHVSIHKDNWVDTLVIIGWHNQNMFCRTRRSEQNKNKKLKVLLKLNQMALIYFILNLETVTINGIGCTKYGPVSRTAIQLIATTDFTFSGRRKNTPLVPNIKVAAMWDLRATMLDGVCYIQFSGSSANR